MTSKRKSPEADFQKNLVDFIRLNAPKVIVFHPYNNGVNRNHQMKMKRLGVLAGIPDLVMIKPGGIVYLLELKAGKGELRDSQKEIRDHCDHNGIPWASARSYDEAIHWLKDWGLISARVAA